MANMTRNIFALNAVRSLIKASPEKHDQGDWASIDVEQIEVPDGATVRLSCGTTACVAGWAATLAGAKFLFSSDSIDEGAYHASEVETVDGRVQTVSEHAQKVLGLSYDEASILFDGDLERGEVLDLLKRLVKGKKIA